MVSNIFVLESCHILHKDSACAMLLPAKEGTKFTVEHLRCIAFSINISCYGQL
jgi:hypothetical protein